MKIALLTHEPFYPPTGGGSAEAIYLVRELVGRGHRVELFCPRFEDASRVGKEFGIRLHLFQTWRMGRYTSLRNLKYVFYPPFLQRMVERAAAASRFDAVLSQHAIAAVAAGRLKERLRVPVVMNFLDYLTGFLENWPPHRAPRPLLRRLKQYELSLPKRYQAEGVLTVSDTLADYFIRDGYPGDRLRPIYYGFDPQAFPYSGPQEATKPKEGRVVMHGSFDQHHLGRIARDAVIAVLEQRPGVRFRFVGRETESLVRLGRDVQASLPAVELEFDDFVPYGEMARHLADATVGIVPYEESTGTHCAFVAKVVEYLAVGLPVVSTPLNGIVRFFGSQPTVQFSEFNGADFARLILAWLDTPVGYRQRICRTASDFVRELLDWKVVSRNAVDFFETSIQRPWDASA